jgi:hypothetical protein
MLATHSADQMRLLLNLVGILPAIQNGLRQFSARSVTSRLILTVTRLRKATSRSTRQLPNRGRRVPPIGRSVRGRLKSACSICTSLESWAEHKVESGVFSIARRGAGNATLFPIYRRLPKLAVALTSSGLIFRNTGSDLRKCVGRVRYHPFVNRRASRCGGLGGEGMDEGRRLPLPINAPYEFWDAFWGSFVCALHHSLD